MQINVMVTILPMHIPKKKRYKKIKAVPANKIFQTKNREKNGYFLTSLL